MARPPADLTIEGLAASLPPSAALMGLDLGSKTIGLAISDAGRRVASPPLNMDGSEGPRVQSTRAFARSLAGLTSLPILFWDERLSTAAVTRTLLEADASRKRRAAVIDKLAATIILQGALDRMRMK